MVLCIHGALFDGQMRSMDRARAEEQEKQHEKIKSQTMRTQKVNNMILCLKTYN